METEEGGREDEKEGEACTQAGTLWNTRTKVCVKYRSWPCAPPGEGRQLDSGEGTWVGGVEVGAVKETGLKS